jgi:L-lactate dehydrogenase complex protein LldG
MKAESASLIPVFETEFEKVGGRCHVASSVKEIAEIILEIASQNKCANLVKQRLEIDGEDQIKTLLADHGRNIIELENVSDPVSLLSKADLAVTRVDMLIAETGTMVITTRTDEARLASCLPRIHIGIVRGENIVQTLLNAAAYLRREFESPGAVSFVSGPSRTADIEMKLILGVHGPHQVHAIILRQ